MPIIYLYYGRWSLATSDHKYVMGIRRPVKTNAQCAEVLSRNSIEMTNALSIQEKYIARLSILF